MKFPDEMLKITVYNPLSSSALLRFTDSVVIYSILGLVLTCIALVVLAVMGLFQKLDALRAVGESTAGLKTALPVNVSNRPIWNPSSIGDPVMVTIGGGAAERK